MNHFTRKFNVVGGNNWGRVFGGVHGGRMVDDVHQCMQLPEGRFVGFFRGTSLAHVMLHTKDGWGAGNKNNCVLSDGHPVGVMWELLDMTQFFLKDKNYNNNEKVDMFHTPIIGQTI